MKKFIVRVTAILLVTILGVGMTACSLGGTKPPEPTPKPTVKPTPKPEPDEIVFLQPGKHGEAYETGIKAVNAALAEKGIKIRVEKYPVEQYADKVNLLVSSGVNFDLFSINENFGTLVSAQKAGLVSDITPTENLKKLFSSDMWKNASVNGKISAVPVYNNEPNGFDSTIGIHKDVLSKTYSYETFPSEGFLWFFLEMLYAMDGTEAYTWLPTVDSVPLWLHRTYDSFPFSVDNFMNLIKITEDGKVSSFYESDEFEKDARMYRSLYNESLINEDVLDGGSSKAIKSQNILPSQGFNDQNAVGDDLAFIKLGESDDYITSFGRNFTALSKTSAHPEKALEFLVWLYSSQDNFDLFHYGSVGEDFTLSKTGRITKTKDAYSMDISLTGYRPFIRYGKDISDTYIEEVTKKSEEATISESAFFVFDNSKVKEQCRTLEKAVKKYIYPIKFGKVSYTDNYTAAIEQLNLAGLREYVAEYKKQYKAFINPEEPKASPKTESSKLE